MRRDLIYRIPCRGIEHIAQKARLRWCGVSHVATKRVRELPDVTIAPASIDLAAEHVVENPDIVRQWINGRGWRSEINLELAVSEIRRGNHCVVLKYQIGSVMRVYQHSHGITIAIVRLPCVPQRNRLLRITTRFTSPGLVQPGV